MIFVHRDRDRDTLSMAVYPTGQHQTPFIYLDTDGLCFLQYHRARWEEPRIRCIPRHEAIRLANLYHLAELKAALLAQKHAAADKSPVPAAASADSPPAEHITVHPVTDPALIEVLHDLSPEQLRTLSEVLNTSQCLA